jgi:hypothetical protein
MKYTIRLLFIAWAMTGSIILSGQGVPVVRLNHISFVLRSHDLSALNTSPFIKDSLTAFQIRMDIGDDGETPVSTFILGKSVYLELFGAPDNVANRGFLTLALSVDSTGELEKLKNYLNGEYLTPTNTMTRDMDSIKVPWFDRLFLIDTSLLRSGSMSQLHFWFWLMEYRPEYFEYKKFRITDSKLTRESYLEAYSDARKNKIIKRFSGIVMRLNEDETGFITRFFKKMGYLQTGDYEYMAPDSFSFLIKDRPVGEENSLESISFETTGYFQNRMIVQVSENIFVVLEGNEGRITFE